MVKSLDETRRVISNEGWEHARTDCLTITYDRVPKVPLEAIRAMNEGKSRNADGRQKCLPFSIPVSLALLPEPLCRPDLQPCPQIPQVVSPHMVRTTLRRELDQTPAGEIRALATMFKISVRTAHRKITVRVQFVRASHTGDAIVAALATVLASSPGLIRGHTPFACCYGTCYFQCINMNVKSQTNWQTSIHWRKRF